MEGLLRKSSDLAPSSKRGRLVGRSRAAESKPQQHSSLTARPRSDSARALVRVGSSLAVAPSRRASSCVNWALLVLGGEHARLSRSRESVSPIECGDVARWASGLICSS